MKHQIIIVVCLILLISTATQSQFIRGYGLKLALTSSDDQYENSFAPNLETKRRIGFNVGGFIEWLDVPFFSFITQLEYDQKGAGQVFNRRDEYNNDLGDITQYGKLDYVSIPLLVKLRYPAGIFTPYIVGGPRFDFLVGFQSDKNLFNTLYRQLKKNSIGGSVGIGVETESILPTTFLAELRYNFDFQDSFKNAFVHTRNDSYDLWLGVAF